LKNTKNSHFLYCPSRKKLRTNEKEIYLLDLKSMICCNRVFRSRFFGTHSITYQKTLFSIFDLLFTPLLKRSKKYYKKISKKKIDFYPHDLEPKLRIHFCPLFGSTICLAFMLQLGFRKLDSLKVRKKFWKKKCLRSPPSYQNLPVLLFLCTTKQQKNMFNKYLNDKIDTVYAESLL
jgi:hypothetical protein